eukprot:scaffold27205_cov37-Cyclotella_meneghiniana.AAC.1
MGLLTRKVREEEITNQQIRKMFHNLPDARSLIAAHTLKFVGKNLRHPDPNHTPKLLLTAWINNKRPCRGVLTTNKKSIQKALQTLYSANSATDPFRGAPCPIDNKGSFGLWLDDALDKDKWEWLIDCQLRKPHLKINQPNSRRRNNNDENIPPPPPPSPRPPPPNRENSNNQTPPSPNNNHHQRNENNVGVTLTASLNYLGLDRSTRRREKPKYNLENCVQSTTQTNTKQNKQDSPTSKPKRSSNSLTMPTN